MCGAAVELEMSRRCDAGVSGKAAEARVRRPTLPLLFPKLCSPPTSHESGEEGATSLEEVHDTCPGRGTYGKLVEAGTCNDPRQQWLCYRYKLEMDLEY